MPTWHPPLESQEPRNQVLSKILPKMMFESLFQRFSLILPPLTWTTKMNVRNHVNSYLVQKSLFWKLLKFFLWNTRQTYRYFVLTLAQNAPRFLMRAEPRPVYLYFDRPGSSAIGFLGWGTSKNSIHMCLSS